MLGILLRSELIQSSAVRTWNCVTNIANFFWFKINNIRRPTMPRTRRRHYSRSRSRSHSHDRDRDVKRRRIDSPDSSHHRRSVSVESELSPERNVEEINQENDAEDSTQTSKDIAERKEATEESTKMSQENSEELKNKETDTKEKSVASEVQNEIKDAEEKIDKSTKETENSTKLSENVNEKEEDEPIKISEEVSDTLMECEDIEQTQNEAGSSAEDPQVKTDTSIIDLEDDSENDKSKTKSEKSGSELDKSVTDLDTTTTPKKLSSDSTNKPSSRKKLSAGQLKAREEREKQRQEAKELQEKLKQEQKEQKLKEKQEKEEQKKKEKIEKEELKRKEKEEKEEQKRKEKEEKEELKRKEKEAKDEQKRKEREEKEEQKRKEREEKELKKQQELEKDKKKLEKESAAFVNFFVSRKSTGAPELKKTEETVSSSFMPFEVKADMRLAPTIRAHITPSQKSTLVNDIESQTGTTLYLQEIKNGKSLGKSFKTWPIEDEVILVEDTDIGEEVEEPTKKDKMRAKLLKFHENRRPAYYGTWRKKSKLINPKKPFELDKNFFDYEVDSDDDWEEEEPGESLRGSDDEEKENESDDYEVDNDFFVPHGYLSDEEVEKEENVPLTPETHKEKLKLLQMEFEQEMKSKTERIKPRLIGCIWESKLKPKIQDAIHTFLEERMMIIPATITIKKRDLNKNTTVKTNTPGRKQLSKEFLPEFLTMIHGNTKNKTFLVNEFLSYLTSKNLDSLVLPSKLGLCVQLKELAQWRKCPDEGAMHNKHCWYVSEDVRKQYQLKLVMPNKWHYTSDHIGAKKKLNL